MEQIIQAFGIDARLIVIQIVNFALLAGLLWYFLYTPVLAMIDRRRETIEEGVRNAEAAARERDAAGKEKADVLAAAHKEAEATLTRADERAKEVHAQTRSEAQAERERILADATARAEEEAARTRRESEAEITKLAVLAAEKVLRNEKASS